MTAGVTEKQLSKLFGAALSICSTARTKDLTGLTHHLDNDLIWTELWKYQFAWDDITAVAKSRFLSSSPRKKALLWDRSERFFKQMVLVMCPKTSWYVCTARSELPGVLQQPPGSRLSVFSQLQFVLCALAGSALVELRSTSNSCLCVWKNSACTKLWWWSHHHWLHCWCHLHCRWCLFCSIILRCCLSNSAQSTRKNGLSFTNIHRKFHFLWTGRDIHRLVQERPQLVAVVFLCVQGVCHWLQKHSHLFTVDVFPMKVKKILCSVFTTIEICYPI